MSSTAGPYRPREVLPTGSACWLLTRAGELPNLLDWPARHFDEVRNWPESPVAEINSLHAWCESLPLVCPPASESLRLQTNGCQKNSAPALKVRFFSLTRHD